MVYKYKEIAKNNESKANKMKFLESLELEDLKIIFAYIVVGQSIYEDKINERYTDSEEDIQKYKQLFNTKVKDINKTYTSKDEIIYEIIDSASINLYQYLKLSTSII